MLGNHRNLNEIMISGMTDLKQKQEIQYLKES